MNCLYIRFLGDNSEEGLRLVSWFYAKKKRGVIVFKSLTDDDPGEVAELIAARYLVVEKNIFGHQGPPYTAVGYRINFFLNSFKFLSGEEECEKDWLYREFFRIYLSEPQFIEEPFQPDLTPTLEEARAIGKIDCILPENFEDLGVIESDRIGRFTVAEEAFKTYEVIHDYCRQGEVKSYRASLISRLRNKNLRKFCFPKSFINRYGLKAYESYSFEIWGHFVSKMQFIIRRDNKTCIGEVIRVVIGNPHDLYRKK